MESLNKTETPIFLSVVCSLFPKAIFFTFTLCLLFLCFSVLFALRLPRFRKRELILVLSYVCSICACLGFSVSSSSWCLGWAAVCDCGTPWTFLLPFLMYKFRQNVGKPEISDHFSEIVVVYKRKGYNIIVMKQSACLAAIQITVDHFAYLFNSRLWVGV